MKMPKIQQKRVGRDKKVARKLAGMGKIYLFCGLKSPNGGIGRRVGLKHQWSNPCRFDPGFGYRLGSFLRESPRVFCAPPAENLIGGQVFFR